MDKIGQSNLLIFASPQQMFSKNEFDTLNAYLNSGRSLLILFNEGGEQKNNSNLNYLLEQYGIFVNNDCVIRTSFYKYLHPKENLIQSGILDKEIVRVANNQQKEIQKQKPAFLSNILKEKDDDDFEKEKEQGGLDFVYPYGASLNIQEPSFSLLSSGPLSYPINRPIMGAYQSRGKLAVIGSYKMFHDDYFEKEENQKIFEFLIRFLLSNEVQLDTNNSE